MLSAGERACLQELARVAAGPALRLLTGQGLPPGHRAARRGRLERSAPPEAAQDRPPEAVGAEAGGAEEAARRAFSHAQGLFVEGGRLPPPRRIGGWLRELAATSLPDLPLEARERLGWEARVLIWIRHQRELARRMRG